MRVLSSGLSWIALLLAVGGVSPTYAQLFDSEGDTLSDGWA